MVTPWSNWCRLCSKDNGCEVELLPNKINGDDKIAWSLQKLMAKHFSVLISDDGQTPTGICRKCHQFIENLQIFSDRVSKVETMFSELIQKQVCLLEDEVDNIRQQYGIAKVKDFDKCDQSTDTNDLMIEYLPVDGDDECSNNMAEVKSEPSDEEGYDNCGDVENYKYKVAPSTNPVCVIIKTENNDDEDECEDEGTSFQVKQTRSRKSGNMSTRKRKLRTKEVEYDSEDNKDDNDDNDDHYENETDEYESGDDDYVADNKNKKSRKGKVQSKSSSQDDDESNKKPFKCEFCDKVLSRKSTLRAHKENIHSLPEELKHECSVCNKKFVTERLLKQHAISHLPPDEKMLHPCPYCDKKFTKSVNVNPHIRSVHFGEKSFICEECGKTFVTKGALKEHSFSHSEEYSYTCSKCPKRFKNTSNLRRHEDIHSNTVYDCPHCGLKLKTRRSLRAHLVVHSDERKYKCQYCDSAFKRPKTLKTHLLVHTGLKPSRCPFCEKAFSNNQNCKNHQRAEHPEEFAALYINQVSNVPISCSEENT